MKLVYTNIENVPGVLGKMSPVTPQKRSEMIYRAQLNLLGYISAKNEMARRHKSRMEHPARTNRVIANAIKFSILASTKDGGEE